MDTLLRFSARTATVLAAAVTTLAASLAAPTALAGPLGTVETTVDLVDPSSGASYDDPYYLNWTGFLPPISGLYTESVRQGECIDGHATCVDGVVDEMTRRWTGWECNHNGPFSFVYLITTMQYRHSMHKEGFYADPEFVNHEDVVFANYYFRAVDAWKAGDVNAVPPVWQVAFEHAEAGDLTTYGDMVMGMAAHILRDLPFVLHDIGLVAPDGTSRKADHDKVNEFLNEASKVAAVKAGAIYDSTLADDRMPGTTLDATASLALIQSWREQAWRKAELLANAPTPEAKQAVAMMIEEEAAAEARLLAHNYAADGDQSERAAYCAENWPDHMAHRNLDQDPAASARDRELDAMA